MRLLGKRPRKFNALDDIFNNKDDYGLLNVKPRAAAPRQGDLVASRFEELNTFIDQHARLPAAYSESLAERQMAQRLKSFQETGDRAVLAPFDRHNLLLVEAIPPEMPLNLLPELEFPSPQPIAEVAAGAMVPSVARTIAPENVMSIDDILGGDDFGMLDVGDLSILNIEHVPATRETTDEVAQRKQCDEFWRFETIFRDLHAGLKSKVAEAVPFAENWQIAEGDAFILHGIMCFVDQVGDEHDRSGRPDARLHLVFENGTESNMLRRSLAKELNKDEIGRRILRNRDDVLAEAFQDIRLTHRDRRTGVIYIVKTKTQNPVLAQFAHLYKIGYTEQTLNDRIKNAERDIAFLEGPVEKAAEFECYNMDPRRFETLIHGFFAVQRLNIELTGKDGKRYRPREWFAVTLDVAREAIHKIIDGTIVQYRMDNTTGRIVKKINSTV
jgi:hypothetical protein